MLVFSLTGCAAVSLALSGPACPPDQSAAATAVRTLLLEATEPVPPVTLSLILDAQKNAIRQVRLGDVALQGDRVRFDVGAMHLLSPRGDALLDVKLNGTVADLVTLACPPPAEPRAQIGITMEDLTPALAAQLCLGEGDAVMIASVAEDGPAARAGVRPFDVVTHIDGAPRVTQEALRAAVQAKKPGDTITLRLLRGGRPVEVGVVSGTASVALATTTLAFDPYAHRVAVGLGTRLAVTTSPEIAGHITPDLRYVVALQQPATSYQTWVNATGQRGAPAGLRQQLLAEIAQLEAQVARFKAMVEKIDADAGEPAGDSER